MRDINRNTNPLSQRLIHDILPFADAFYDTYLTSVVDREVFRRAVYLAKDPYDLAQVPGLTPGERSVLEGERTLNPLKQSKALKVVTLVTACAAITQLVSGDLSFRT
jgi:hypothetical protein